MDACASETKIVRTDIDSRRSGDTTFEREVNNVVVGVGVTKKTHEDTVNKGRLLFRHAEDVRMTSRQIHNMMKRWKNE